MNFLALMPHTSSHCKVLAADSCNYFYALLFDQAHLLSI